MIKKFFTGYVIGLVIFGLVFFGLSSKLAPATSFRPPPIEFDGVELELP